MIHYANFTNGEIIGNIVEELPKFWTTPDKKIITSFNKLLDNGMDKLNSYNWYIVDEESLNPSYDPNFESVVFSAWYLDNNILKRHNTKVEHNFSNGLAINFKILEENRFKYINNGFNYSYMNMNLKILADPESINALNASYVAANNNIRQDTDTWKFINLDNNSIVALTMSNSDLINMAEFIFRKIQDSYNLETQIANQMLSTGNTSTLRAQITNNTINLNPWNV